MRRSRALLQRFFHDPRFSLSDVEVCYVDRGAPMDESCVSGDRIVSCSGYFLEVSSPAGVTPVPFHRIRRIRYQGRVVWDYASREEPHLPDLPEGESRRER